MTLDKTTTVESVINANILKKEFIGKTGICPFCRKEYSGYHTGKTYCSVNCRNKAHYHKKKKDLTFFEEEHAKPKMVKNIVAKKNIDWIHLQERISKHKSQLSTLTYQRKNIESELLALADKNKNTILYALIGAGITMVGGYLLYEYNKKSDTKKEQIESVLKVSAGIPIGVIIGALGLLSTGIGYGVAYIQNSIVSKSKKVIQKIQELNYKANQITGEIRLEEMSITELTKQQEFVREYDSITETISKIEVVQ